MGTAGQTERNRRGTLAQIGGIGLNQIEPADEGDYESQQIQGGKLSIPDVTQPKGHSFPEQ